MSGIRAQAARAFHRVMEQIPHTIRRHECSETWIYRGSERVQLIRQISADDLADTVFCVGCDLRNQDLCVQCVPSDKLYASYPLSALGT